MYWMWHQIDDIFRKMNLWAFVSLLCVDSDTADVREQLVFLVLLRLRMLVRERNDLSSAALLSDQSMCPWYQTYQSRHAGSFIVLVSLPPGPFDYLLSRFSRHYVVQSGAGRRGRPPRVHAKHCVLAMLLSFYTNPCEYAILGELFSVHPTTVSRMLRRAEAALALALDDLDEARVAWPSRATQEVWATASTEREPLVTGAIAFVDGKNFRVQEPSEVDRQNAYYNGNISYFSFTTNNEWCWIRYIKTELR
jgi:hypothetical protein